MTDIYWIWLANLSHVGPVLQKSLLDTFGTPENTYLTNRQDLLEFQQKVKGVHSRAIQSILKNKSLDKAKLIKQQCSNQNIQIVTMDNPYYVEKAKKCPESPIILYVKGTLRKIGQSIAIIGSRRCSSYGKQVAHQIATEISSQDIPVISGMAKGIDGYSHTAVINNQGYTMAFLASGVDLCYPSEHRILYEQIIKKGAILSKYPPGTKALPPFFVERNALISGWSDKLIVVEAGANSGALSTVNYSIKYNREVFVVPSRIDSPNGKGSNMLLATVAKPYLGIESITMKSTNKNRKSVQRKNNQFPLNPPPPTLEQKLVELLFREAMHISKLQRLLALSNAELEELLFQLEMKDRVIVKGEYVSIKK